MPKHDEIIPADMPKSWHADEMHEEVWDDTELPSFYLPLIPSKGDMLKEMREVWGDLADILYDQYGWEQNTRMGRHKNG